MLRILGLLLLGTVLTGQALANAPVRIKDIADFEGVRDNQLIGYGLVVGLDGTGDSTNSIDFTRQGLTNLLHKLGVAVQDVDSDNVAAVMVTASMDSLARQGSKMDITVSSLGDAESLEGGLLLATPLLGADGNTYAVGQGALIVGGFTASGNAGSISRNHPTVGRIANGATIERETGFELSQLGDSFRLILRDPDFTTAIRVQDMIDKTYGNDVAKVVDHGVVQISIKDDNISHALAMHKIENLLVRPASAARIIIDEKTGTIVMGEDVRISNVAISHANLTIRIQEEQVVSQPVAFTFNEAAETVVLDRTTVTVEEETVQDPTVGRFKQLDTGASLSDLIKGLNALGVQPRDVISILQNIKAAGAIQAEVIVL